MDGHIARGAREAKRFARRAARTSPTVRAALRAGLEVSHAVRSRALAERARQAGRFTHAAVGTAARAVLDFVYPPACPLTDVVVDAPGRLAPEAWAALTFVSDPMCVRCGAPFEYPVGEGVECAACVAAPPKLARARAPLVYDDASRRLMLEFKHSARADAAPTFVRWMAQAAGESLADADSIMPVPLHPARLRARRFNQSALLALALADLGAKTFDPDTLARIRATPSQGGLGAAGRARNVRGAFRVRPARKPGLAGARVLLVDDVFTTGATLDAAARALLRAGAARVDAVALARVVRPRDVSI